MTRYNTNISIFRMLLAVCASVMMFASSSVLAQGTKPSSFGVTAAVQGNVQLIAFWENNGAAAVRSGHFIYAGDRLITGDSGRLQLLLSDGTVFTLGSNTDFRLTEYSYDPETGNGKVVGRVDRGSFRVVSGRIGELNPGNISVAMPTGTVKLRGTIVAGESDGEEDTVVLLGPGAQKNSADKQGSFEYIPKGAAVMTSAGGEDEETGETTEPTILVYRAGYAVTVTPDGTVSEPFEMSGRDFGQLVSSLVSNRGGSGGDDVDGDDDPEDLAGDGGDDLDDDENLADNDDVDEDEAIEDSEEDKKDDLDALLEAQDITKVVELEEITGMKGRYIEEDVPMYIDGKKDKSGENTFDFRFQFGYLNDGDGQVDFIGFENIQTAGNEDEDIAGIEEGELSWDALTDLEEGEDPDFEELDFSSDPEEGQGTLTARDGCAGEDAALCEGSITVLNAGEGNIAKFFILDLETETATFNDKLVKPGGNNNFPQDEYEDSL